MYVILGLREIHSCSIDTVVNTPKLLDYWIYHALYARRRRIISSEKLGVLENLT